MFGFNTPSIDSKGRIAIPARYRKDFRAQNQNTIVITKDPQYPSLKIYPELEWNSISNKLQSLQGLDPIVRNLQWTILGNAYQTDIDVDGRMLVRMTFLLYFLEERHPVFLSTEILDVVLPESIKEMSF